MSDDGSSDGSRDLIEEYARTDKRIVPFIQQENIGLVRNYNFLFDHSRGDLVAIQDADDWSDPGRFEKQVAVLENPAYALCATGSIFHYPHGQTRHLSIGDGRVINGIFDDFTSHPASVMFRAALLKQFPGWPIYFEGGTSMDRYYLMDLLDGRKGYHIGEPLYHARVRSGSNCRVWSTRKMTTHSLFIELERQRRESGTDWLREGQISDMEEFERSVGRDRRLKAVSMRDGAVINVDCAEYRAAASLLARSIALDLTSPLAWRSALYLARKSLSPR